MPKLTVLIPCKDEAHNITECIESIRPIADEILVADSGSTDGTLDIVRSRGDCRVIEREYINSADFKNWAIPQARHPWVLVCDADERPDPLLIEEIQALLRTEPACDGYRIGARIFCLGYPIRYSGRNSHTNLRLFRKAVGRYETKRVHAQVVVETGKVGKLEGRFDHHTCQCLNRFAQTQNRYATWSALDMYESGRRVKPRGIFWKPIVRFFQFYVLRRGFLDGTGGLLMCTFTAYSTFLKYAKLWELEHSRTPLMRRRESPDDNRTTDLDEYRRDAA